MKFAAVKDAPGLLRDLSTGAVINVDDSAYLNHKKKKAEAIKKLQQEEAKEQRINNIEKDVKELKEGINQILEMLKNGNN